MKNFQHNNNIEVNDISYKYVYQYKKQLLENITKLMDDLKIKFVIAHGNLIEYEREAPIYHDDDLDIRYSYKHLEKWENFCKSNVCNLTKYNLRFDSRFKKIIKQKHNGIQCYLIKFNNINNILEFNDMDIHCDLVPSKVNITDVTDYNFKEIKFFFGFNELREHVWIDYNINFKNLRIITLYGIKTYAPSKNDTIRVLTREYGIDYLIPLEKNDIKIITKQTINLINDIIINTFKF